MNEGVFDGQSYQAPHCNQEVLHAPGTCYYCDHYPSRQAARAASGTAFSPPEANGWSGNIAVKVGEVTEHLGVRYVVGAPSTEPVIRRNRYFRRSPGRLTPWQRFLHWIYNSWGGQ